MTPKEFTIMIGGTGFILLFVAVALWVMVVMTL